MLFEALRNLRNDKVAFSKVVRLLKKPQLAKGGEPPTERGTRRLGYRLRDGDDAIVGPGADVFTRGPGPHFEAVLSGGKRGNLAVHDVGPEAAIHHDPRDHCGSLRRAQEEHALFLVAGVEAQATAENVQDLSGRAGTYHTREIGVLDATDGRRQYGRRVHQSYGGVEPDAVQKAAVGTSWMRVVGADLSIQWRNGPSAGGWAAMHVELEGAHRGHHLAAIGQKEDEGFGELEEDRAKIALG